MNPTKNLILSIFLVLGFFSISLAQPATFRGKITNGTTGEIIIGATILLQDASFAMKGGAYSDIEGSYTIKAPAGSYKVVISYLGFVGDTLDVTGTGGEVVFNETLLLEENVQTDEVIITAKRSQASDVAFQRQKQNSINSIDGVTFDLVQRTGDANAAAAIVRVVGVTVEGGKYVYVRGLGDRYSKTLLNGADLPGLDPNRNTVQMDIFPSNLIDNITVYKNFTPDLPASFTGGLVNIVTKDFPDRFTLKVSGSLGFNTQASLLNGTFSGESLQQGEALAFANDIRDVPSVISDDLNGTIPNFPITLPQLNQRGQQIEDATRSFQTSFQPASRNSGLNHRFGVSFGNQHQVGKGSFGYIASISYRRAFSFFDDGQRNQFVIPSAGSSFLDANARLRGSRGEDETLWGSLVKLSYKPFKRHKFSVNYMHNQNGLAYGEAFEGSFNSSGGNIRLQTKTTGYIERSLDILQAQGNHAFGGDDAPDRIEIDWIVSNSLAQQNEPDLRFFANEVEIFGVGDTVFDLNNGNGYSNPLRFFRTLTENNQDAKANVKIQIPGISTDTKGFFKFGGAYTAKTRDFSETRFELVSGLDAAQFNGSIDDYLAEDNLFDVTPVDGQIDPQTGWFQGLYYTDRTLSTNQFEATQDIIAGYGMIELPLGDKLRFIGGARYEGTDMVISPADSTLFDPLLAADSTASPGELQLQDILPAANLILTINDKMNLRAGFTRTLARPSIVELSPFQRLPYIGGPIYLGNPLLERTLIDNFDARWEWFFNLGELVSASVFYKNFTNPIVLSQDFRTQNLRFIYTNQDQAFVYGLELELKKNFGFISEDLQKLQLNFNASFINSAQQIDAAELEIIRAVDPDRPDTRPLFGQSPYVFNAELAYIDKEELGLQASASFNVFGPRLFAVGGVAPDIYEQPRPQLNFSLAKDIGSFVTIRLRARNILNPEFRFTQDFKGTENVFKTNTIGASYSLGASFKIN